MARRLIFSVASQSEHADLAVEFVKRHFETLADKFGSSFRATSMSNLMANFSDPARAEELKQFAPAHETSSEADRGGTHAPAHPGECGVRRAADTGDRRVGAPASGDAVATRRFLAGSWAAKLLGRQGRDELGAWTGYHTVSVAESEVA
jgi:hypothetical protein